jgi:hypothetical protein
MLSLPDTIANTAISYNTAASGTAGVITLTAVVDGYNVLDWIIWSYAAAPTSGSLTITGVGASPVFSITAAGPGQIMFGDRGMKSLKNTAIVLTLADGSATKYLIVQYR